VKYAQFCGIVTSGKPLILGAITFLKTNPKINPPLKRIHIKAAFSLRLFLGFLRQYVPDVLIHTPDYSRFYKNLTP
jgi:hypothetical protein